MNVFYEEDGGFKAGSVLADQGASLQVESSTGKRSKVKAGHVLFDFREPEPASLLRDAQAMAGTIDLAFLWECAPQSEFSFKDLALEYFGHAPTPVESGALVTRLHSAPMYFYRKGRGTYRAAPPDTLKAALASVERKQRDAELQREHVAALVEGRLPEALHGRVHDLLFKSDKSRLEWKAVAEAAAARRTTPERLMLAVGGIASPLALHRGRFLSEHFPKGLAFPDVRIPDVGALPVADVEAFSIDDSSTTEIDDALSVTRVSGDADVASETTWRIGIHIAAPGLVVRRGDPIDLIAHERYSTVYAPGEKITMLPDAVVDAFSLAAGRASPALSLYVTAVEASDGTWTLASSASRVERVWIADNLRHDRLDDVVTAESLGDRLTDPLPALPRGPELAVLYRFARWLHAKRQETRVASGLRPETRQRPDYAFKVERADDASDTELTGRERVTIVERRRDAPLDVLVAELMILANSTWGRLLKDRGVPGIYRAQSAAFGPAGRVRMVTQPAPHVGLGVAQYAWTTSPLRRYVDLVNQRQVIACVEAASSEGAVSAPFATGDADLFAIVSGFDAAYAAYATYQSKMERFWCLRWLAQAAPDAAQRVHEARATGRDDTAMLLDVPLLLRVPGLGGGGPGGTPLAVRGQRIEAEVVAIDEVDLTVDVRLVALIEEVDEIDDEVLDEVEPLEANEPVEDDVVTASEATAEVATDEGATNAAPPQVVPSATDARAA